MAQIGNKGGYLMVDGDKGPYYVSCIIASSVSHYCLDIWLFLEIRMSGNGHLQNIETTKKYKFMGIFIVIETKYMYKLKLII